MVFDFAFGLFGTEEELGAILQKPKGSAQLQGGEDDEGAHRKENHHREEGGFAFLIHIFPARFRSTLALEEQRKKWGRRLFSVSVPWVTSMTEKSQVFCRQTVAWWRFTASRKIEIRIVRLKTQERSFIA
jgi:hypothetical protein